ncbi:DUF4097 domain-containing protein [Candidatus Bathyarchaeota archaeon]|nr:DUF4097 domain-containing protein [Candidatus Bathyarchaeota archaeon]
MKRSTKNIILALVVIAGVIGVSVAAAIHNALAPPEQREDTSYFTPNENVAIKAFTFNGDIQVEPIEGSQIIVTYQAQAPYGYLKDIQTSAKETVNGSLTTIVAAASRPTNVDVEYHASLIIKLPKSATYNLTLTTSSGDVNIQTDKAREVGVITDNGDVTVSLPQSTQFQVTASVANGVISHQGITLDTSVDSATRLKGATATGESNLVMTLMSGYGDITIKYTAQRAEVT